jgi:mono/diheme cytochrome c family protein
MSALRTVSMTLAVAVLALAAIQLIPYGRQHTAPADGQLTAFDSPRTAELAQRACFDCHSNRTQWPWYSSLAPISWRIQNHVDEGRKALNFTALDTSSEDGAEAAGEAGETLQKGEMPPQDYLLAHPEARLTAQERQDLARGLDRTFAALTEKDLGHERGAEREAGEGGEHEDRDD